MPRSRPRPELPPKVLAELQRQLGFLSSPESGLRMWERLMTPAERQRLGGKFEAAYRSGGGTVRIWMRLRGVSQIRAIVEIAQGIGFLTDATAAWLLRESGEQQQHVQQASQPAWDSSTGVLRYAGKRIRKVRMMKNPSNIQRILDAFEDQGWPKKIENPLAAATDQQQLHQALRSLNNGLSKIHFHAQEGGQSINWDTI